MLHMYDMSEAEKGQGLGRWVGGGIGGCIETTDGM